MQAERKSTVFITGATGFIGKKLAIELAQRGEQVKALVRSPQKAADLTHPNITIVKGDLDDPEALKGGMDGCDRLFHLAAFAKAFRRTINCRSGTFDIPEGKVTGVPGSYFRSAHGEAMA